MEWGFGAIPRHLWRQRRYRSDHAVVFNANDNAPPIAVCKNNYTANWHNFTFLIPHPNPPPLGEGVYEKRRLCQFAVYLTGNAFQIILRTGIILRF